VIGSEEEKEIRLKGEERGNRWEVERGVWDTGVVGGGSEEKGGGKKREYRR